MPTAARLVAALCLGGLGLIVSGLIVPYLPEGTDVGYLPVVNLGLGLLCGWIVVGKRASGDLTLTEAVTLGLTGGAALVFWGLFVQGCNEMVRLAMRNRYDGPFEAIMAIFEIGTEYGKLLIAPEILGTLFLGSLVTGVLARFAASRWR